MIYLSIISIFIGAVLLIQMEQLLRDDKKRIWFNETQHGKFGKWWESDNWKGLQWWKKYILSFLIDGEHFCKFWGIVFICFSYIPYDWVLSISMWLAFWIATETSYNIKVRT